MGDARAAAMAMAGVTAKKVDGKDYWIVACRDRGMVDVIQVSYVVIYIYIYIYAYVFLVVSYNFSR